MIEHGLIKSPYILTYQVCEDAFSVEITSLDIATCVENCQLALDRLCGEEEGDAGQLLYIYNYNSMILLFATF